MTTVPSADGRWVAETHVAPELDMVNATPADVFNLVIRDLVEKVLDAAGEPVEMLISVKEHRPGEWDKNTFTELRPGWVFKAEGRKRL